jgi:hypothetical protein
MPRSESAIRSGPPSVMTLTMNKWLRSIWGQCIAFTGTAWLPRAELQAIIRKKGGISTPRGRVTRATTVLVRGESSEWAFGEYGNKEREAARLISEGVRISIVYEAEFRKLLEEGKPARVADRIAGEPVEWLMPATMQQFRRAALRPGPLDREHTVRGRIEQAFLRQNLCGSAEQATCSLCGKRLPVGLLVAAHIKPRSECSSAERRDADNIVFCLCLLGCDALYERGLVAVAEGGRIVISSDQHTAALTAALSRFRGRKCAAWNPVRARYFNWHLTRRFQGTV